MKLNFTNLLLSGILIALCYVGFISTKIYNDRSKFEFISMETFDPSIYQNHTVNPLMMNRETGQIFEMTREGDKYKWELKMSKK